MEPARRQDTDASLETSETRGELKAAIGARRELGPEMEEHVIEAFLRRIEDRIDVRVASELAAHANDMPQESHRGRPELVVAPSLALAIPLVAIAGAEAGGVGIASVMIVVLAINLFYFIQELVITAHPRRR